MSSALSSGLSSNIAGCWSASDRDCLSSSKYRICPTTEARTPLLGPADPPPASLQAGLGSEIIVAIVPVISGVEGLILADAALIEYSLRCGRL